MQASQIRFVHSPYSFGGMVPVACVPIRTDFNVTDPKTGQPVETKISARPFALFSVLEAASAATPCPTRNLALIPSALLLPGCGCGCESYPSITISAPPHPCHHHHHHTIVPAPSPSIDSIHSVALSREASDVSVHSDESPRSEPSTTSGVQGAKLAMEEVARPDPMEAASTAPGQQRPYVQMGQPAVMLGSPCAHIESWKRLRAKQGFAHYLCEQCGNKWKRSKLVF